MCLTLLGLSAGNIGTAMLLYQAPSGIAVFSFDLSYLNSISSKVLVLLVLLVIFCLCDLSRTQDHLIGFSLFFLQVFWKSLPSLVSKASIFLFIILFIFPYASCRQFKQSNALQNSLQFSPAFVVKNLLQWVGGI